MELLKIELSPEKFDAAVHGPMDGQPSLPDAGDMAIYVKPGATEKGNAGAVVTFTVQLPNGSTRRAQCVTTVANLLNALSILRGWQEGGHLD